MPRGCQLLPDAPLCCRLLADRCGIYFDMQDVDGTDSRLVTDDGRTVALMDVRDRKSVV